MISYPNAKINIGLYITERLADGYHSIETVFLPIPNICDALEIVTLEGENEGTIRFQQTGIQVDADSEDNLCVRAYRTISQLTDIPSVAIHLHKQIPTGAGLGGGSSDGAFALRMLNSLSSSPLTDGELATLALSLGSDCPFFLENSPCHATGRGNRLTRIEPNLKGYHLVLVNPGIHVPTGKAYSLSKPKPSPIDLKQTVQTNVYNWKGVVANDFEEIVFALHPLIGALKAQLYDLGAIYASMSGSGSTVYGIFKERPDVEENFKNMFVHYSPL